MISVLFTHRNSSFYMKEILLCENVYLGVGETGTFLGDPFRSQLPKDFSMLLC